MSGPACSPAVTRREAWLTPRSLSGYDLLGREQRTPLS